MTAHAVQGDVRFLAVIVSGCHQREISSQTVTECLRSYLGALFPKRALLRRQPREASVGLKVADQGVSALQSDLANGLNIIGHDGYNGQTYNRPIDAPVTAARDSGAVRLPVLGELKAGGRALCRRREDRRTTWWQRGRSTPSPGNRHPAW
jgi:hypothetical protein